MIEPTHAGAGTIHRAKCGTGENAPYIATKTKPVGYAGSMNYIFSYENEATNGFRINKC